MAATEHRAGASARAAPARERAGAAAPPHAQAGALLAAALALPGVVPSDANAQAAPDRGWIELRYLDYRDWQPGADRMTVRSPSMYAVLPLSDTLVAEGSMVFDSMSGASPLYYNTLSGASGLGVTDYRTAGDAKLTKYFDGMAVGVAAAVSSERDYLSRAGSVEWRIFSDDRNRTWAFVFGGANDRINPTNGLVVNAPRNTLDFLVGVTQALSATAIVQSNLTYSRGHGYYSDPYKSLDTRPTSRTVFAWLTRYNQHLPTSDATLRLSYRFLHDSFGSTSNAFEATWFQPLAQGWSVAGSLRYYTQTAADFYYDPPFPQGYAPGQILYGRHAPFGVRCVHAGDHRREDVRRGLERRVEGGVLPAAGRLGARGQRQPRTPALFRAVDRGRHREDVLTRASTTPSMRLFRTVFRAMAAEHEILLWSDDEARASRAAEAAVADVLRIEAKYSRYRDDSVTTRINRAAGGEAVAIDAETAALLSYADRCHRLSAGRFDLTSGVLRRAWDFRRVPPQVPDAATLAEATALIGWHRVEWDERSVRLPAAGMEIDFGGIGKEYAADRAATVCIDHGVTHGLVNLGGDVRATGPQPDGEPWRVGIRHPRREGAAIATVLLDSGAVATSGDYERYIEIAGQRYCHILDPRTGRPVAHWQSVSVVAPLCVVAGSCATIAMLLEREAESFLRDQGLRYVAVDAAGRLYGAAARGAASAERGAEGG